VNGSARKDGQLFTRGPVFLSQAPRSFVQLARALISGKVAEGAEVKFSVKDDALVMK
jgi:hypothetical protein